jgi:hypothetical protein
LGVAVVDMANPTDPPAVLPPTDVFNAPVIRLVPGTHKLVLVNRGSSNTLLIDVTGGGPVIARRLPVGCANTQDLAVNPKGESFVVACGELGQLFEYDFTGAVVRTYPAAHGPRAAAFSPVGSGFAGASNGPTALWEYESSGPRTVLRQALGFGVPVSGGLGYSADGETVYAVIARGFVGPVVLHTFPGTAGKPTTEVDVSAPETAPVGTPFTVTGTLTFADGTPAAGLGLLIQPVTFFVGPVFVTTDADGNFSASLATPFPGEQRYVVKYAGDPQHNAAATDFTFTAS